eukprot:c43555_g1_i1 orf=480-1532(-)
MVANEGEEQQGTCEELKSNSTDLKSCVESERPAEIEGAGENQTLDAAARASNGNGLVHQDEPKPLSKNAQKKLLKMERYKAKKMERKAFEKSKRHEETERKRKEWDAKLSSMSAEEQDIALREKKENRMARKEKWNDRKGRLRGAMESGQNLVIDLEFCDRMKPNELASLVQQVMYSYAANAKAGVPVRFSLTGCNGEILGHLQRVSGFENWLVHKEEKSYLEVFKERKQDLVYLTADSDCVIDQLEDSKIYIIGGLVDRNRWKGLTLEKAISQGISTAKLPILEHLKMTSSVVLTVNQVVEIFLRFLESKKWEVALGQVIPLRKRSGEEVHDDSDQTQSKSQHYVETSE